MAIKATLLTLFSSSALLTSGTGPDGFLARGTSANETANSGDTGVMTAEMVEASVVAATSAHAEVAVSAGDDSLPEVGEVSAEEDREEMPDSLVAFFSEAEDSDANESVDVSTASTANCDTKLLRKLQKKVGYHSWHDCVDPNPEICRRIDAAIKAYIRKGGKRAAKKSICRHQDDFKTAFEHNGEKCKILTEKAKKEGLHLPSSQKSLKHMCR